MKQALVVRKLTEQIVLLRLDTGELVSMSVPCRSLVPGTMLMLDVTGSGCPIISVEGKSCKTACRRTSHAVVIEHKDRISTGTDLDETALKRDVI